MIRRKLCKCQSRDLTDLMKLVGSFPPLVVTPRHDAINGVTGIWLLRSTRGGKGRGKLE